MKNWIIGFSKEIEKLSFPFLGAAMNAAMVAGTAGDIKQSQQTNKLQSLKQNEQSMQLPSSSNINTGDSKKIDSYANSVMPRY
jgi:hypothetical protein